MRDFEPDYEKYTLSQLYDALEYIDREAWPERVEQIESILNDPKKFARLLEQQERIDFENNEYSKRIDSGIVGIFLISAGVFGALTGGFWGRQGVSELDVGPISYFLGGFMVFSGVCIFLKSLNK